MVVKRTSKHYEGMPEQLCIRGIPEIIGDFAGRDTPEPKYPALAFRN